jgi:integrase
MRIEKETKSDGTTRYTARVQINGKNDRVRARTKREVEQKAAKMKEQADRRCRGLPVEEAPRPDITYGALCDLLLDGYTHREQSKRTLGYNLRYSRDSFERTLVRNLRFEHARAWFARLTTLAPTTRRNALSAARQAFNFAVETGYAHENPFRKIDKPRATESKQPFETWDEVFAVAAALPRATEAALVLFACATGLRPQEWRALQWRDIDRPTGVLRVNRTVQDEKIAEANAKTPGALRAVELTDLALEALDSLPTQLRRDQLVFPGKRGGVLDTHGAGAATAPDRGRTHSPQPVSSTASRARCATPSPRSPSPTADVSNGSASRWATRASRRRCATTTNGSPATAAT